jgi:hypothetical protein
VARDAWQKIIKYTNAKSYFGAVPSGNSRHLFEMFRGSAPNYSDEALVKMVHDFFIGYNLEKYFKSFGKRLLHMQSGHRGKHVSAALPASASTAMQNFADFIISDEAKQRIVFLTTEHQRKIGGMGGNVIPAILWIDSELNDGTVASQPALGFYHERRDVEGDTIFLDGLEIVLAVSDEDRMRFRGKILDYENNRFTLKDVART